MSMSMLMIKSHRIFVYVRLPTTDLWRT